MVVVGMRGARDDAAVEVAAGAALDVARQLGVNPWGRAVARVLVPGAV